MKAAIILAAGQGTRMQSDLPKVMHPLAGRPMIRHLLAAAEAVFERGIVVIGPGMDELAASGAPPAPARCGRRRSVAGPGRDELAATVVPHATVLQAERMGTGHAARMAAPLLD